jgi:thioredoxin reductase (NADPH)
MRPLKNLCEVAVIGGGLAGLAAARHAARFGRLVTLFEVSALFGGLVATIDEVEGLAVPGRFSGQSLAMHLLEDARKAGVQVIAQGIAELELGARLTLTDQDHKTYHPEAVIIASGATLRKLGVRREEEFLGRGCRIVRPAMADSFAARMSRWSAAGTAPSRRLCCLRRPAGESPWSAAVP